MLRVLLVDDQALIRQAISVMLDATDDITIVGQGDTGLDAIAMAQRLQPDVVLMDLQMPDMSGVDAIREINRKHRGACIVALTTFGTQEYIISALRAGASGYLMKDCGDLLTGHPKILTDEAAAAGLAPREKELLIWLGQGMTNAQIAAKMFISEGSVKQYLSHIGDKMGLKSRTQILVRAIQLGLVDPTLMTPGLS